MSLPNHVTAIVALGAAVVATAATAPIASAGSITGSGTNAAPYTAPCDSPGAVCTVTFAQRTLTGWLANEYIPAYQCPADHPWLQDRDYAPFGTALPSGVEVDEPTSPWAIGVSITGTSHATLPDGDWAKTGTLTGFPNSSATNWNRGTNVYVVALHCTNDPEQAAPYR